MVEYLTVDIKCHIDWNDSKEEINNEFGGLPRNKHVSSYMLYSNVLRFSSYTCIPN